jgi:uncharacterized membrane protein HdeD (DUF308 family)
LLSSLHLSSLPHLKEKKLTRLKRACRLLLLSLLEYAFATYPSTQNSSLGFCIAMLVVLTGVYYGRVAGEDREEQAWEVEDEGGEKSKKE